MELKRISAVQFLAAFCLFSTDSRPNSLLGAPPSFHHQPQFSRWVLSGGSTEQRRNGANGQTSGRAWFEVSGHPEELGADVGLLPDGVLWRRFVQPNEAALMQSETGSLRRCLTGRPLMGAPQPLHSLNQLQLFRPIVALCRHRSVVISDHWKLFL